MKFKFTHPAPSASEQTGPKYWRSLDEVANTPGFHDWVSREFPAGAAELEGVNRRHFLKIMAASFGLAGLGLAGCRQPQQKLLAYSKQPERIVPGVPLYYASSMPTSRDNIPLIVETQSARPTKIEGNPSYVPYGGAANLFAQASVLDLYDPDRATTSLGKDKSSISRAAVQDVFDRVLKKLKSDGGQGVAFLVEPSTSPTRASLVDALSHNYPQATWVEYDPSGVDSQENALQDLTGKRLRPLYDFYKAKRILSLECNFVQSEPGALGYSRAFSRARKVDSEQDAASMSRLYIVESDFSLTGGMADHRLRAASSHIPAVAALIAASILEQTNGEASLVTELRKSAQGLNVDEVWVRECAKDLVAHPGESLVVAGSDQPAAVHAAVYLMNQALGSQGKTVQYIAIKPSAAQTIQQLAASISSGSIETLVIIGGNPAYNAPSDLNWHDLQAKVAEVIRVGYWVDETSAVADYHIAANHYLESWSDGRTWDGTYVPVQPMIQPLFEGWSDIEVLARMTGATQTDPFALVQATFQREEARVATTISFDQWLAEGLLAGSAFDFEYAPIIKSDAFKGSIVGNITKPEAFSAERVEIKFATSQQVGDGRYNNNGWLQECPEPMTKLTWDNAILIGPKLAKELQASSGLQILPDETVMNDINQLAPNTAIFKIGKENARMAELRLGKSTVRGPLHVLPGLADYTVVVTRGYGRTVVGRVGQGTGFSVYPLITSDAMSCATGGRITVLNEAVKIANTQQHWSVEGRAILREANSEDYAAHPDFVEHMCVESHSPAILGPAKGEPLSEVVNNIPRGNSMYQTPEFKSPQQWGMVIDLNSCTGCNACVIACQSENNIPIVGKDQVLRGREMQWIRLDRYFSSGPNDQTIPEDPQVSFMGMMCQHCELAPCETVCPVNATIHDDQGLNVMAYNRCVGTRYCANNCPYKVRRFNFFDWNKRSIGHFYEGPFGPAGMPELHKMQKNPDVTVRMRGVMEKCTYCVQRIQEAKITQLTRAKDSGNVTVADGVIKTACQQTCPADAIVFGDVADSTTEVSKWVSNDRNYSVLGYLNTRPRTTYLARLRNPNPAMPDYQAMPLSRRAYETRYGHGSGHESAAEHSETTHT